MKVKMIFNSTMKDEHGETYTALGDGGLFTNDQTGEVFVTSEIKNGNPVEILPAGNFPAVFYDIEKKCIVHEFDLVFEFAMLKSEDPETYDYSLSDYIRNCTCKNGTLDLLED